MRLAYKFNIGNNENISSLCKISNNLYNQALYIFRETLSNEDKWLSYFKLDDIMKNTKNLDGDINYRNVPIYSVAITKHTLSTRAIPLHRSLEYPLLDQFSFVYNPPSTCWMYMPLLIISEGFTPIPI